MNSPFKVPEWYDPDKNIIIDLDWDSSDVFEARDTVRGDKVPCVVGINGVRIHAIETRWGKKAYFGKDGLDEDNNLILDPASKYKYYKIPRLARFGRSISLYDKVLCDYNSYKWVVFDVDESAGRYKCTNGFEYRWFERGDINLIESLTPPKTIKEQIKCVLNKIARTKIIRAITGLFVG